VKSVFARILLWFFAALAVSLVGFVATTLLVARPQPPEELFSRLQDLEMQGAIRAYEQGGPDQLKTYLTGQPRFPGATYCLTDARGRDLATGLDRSGLLTSAPSDRPWPRVLSGRILRVGTSNDGRYRFILSAKPPIEPWTFLPYYVWILLPMALIGYGLAVILVRPLRLLRDAVERFGGGELSARTGLIRRDEFGVLASTFDQMADRIETLLKAERRLLQDISHELRSPLARLVYAVELARAGRNLQPTLDRIQREAERLTKLIDELVQATPLEGDGAPTRVQPVDLNRLVRALVQDCAIEAEARPCRLELCADATVSVPGNPELLRRAIENVVRNAIRHTAKGTLVEVTISCHEGRARVDVRDHGPGVPEQHLSDIFAPLFRLDQARSEESGGVGLGLAIAQRAVSLHHGRVQAENASPGLKVSVELPMD